MIYCAKNCVQWSVLCRGHFFALVHLETHTCTKRAGGGGGLTFFGGKNTCTDQTVLLLCMQSGPTDLRHFDPTLTCIPPTLSDLITTERSLHVEDFNYVAPDNPKMIKKYKDCPDTLLENEAVRITTVKVTGGSRSGTNCVSQDSKRENTTDEEKAFISKKGGANLLTVASAGQEGQFVEGKLERSGTPFVSKVVVTADVNPQS